jgi:hypothetical protein
MNLGHPLAFVPTAARRPLFIGLLVWTLGLMAVMQVINRPLLTEIAPSGIVSFELAGTPERARQILSSWYVHYDPTSGCSLASAPLYAAFSLGLDYLFMPSYALAIALGVLLGAGRQRSTFASLGAWLGWGALVAALFDAVENLALWRELTGASLSAWPQVAAICAGLKFALILLGLGYALLAWVIPRPQSQA